MTNVPPGHQPTAPADALESLLRLSVDLESEVRESIQNLIDFAQRETDVDWPTAECESSYIPIPLRWKAPGPGQLSPEGQELLEKLRQKTPGIDDVWWLINGRRRVVDICARSAYSEDVTTRYVELMVQEGACRSAHRSD